jgi:transcriptional regulator with XRE-family HTH domain
MTRTELQQAKAGIGTRLRETRKAQGLTQEDLAALAGTNQAVIQKIENGKSRQPRIMEGLAIALEVNPAWLQLGEPYAAVQVNSQPLTPGAEYSRLEQK